MTDKRFEENIKRMQSGDQEGLKEIYQEYIAFIYTSIYGILHNRENAEDIAADFFIKLWDIAESYRFGGKHRAWMATIAHNMAIDFIRKKKKEQLVEYLPEQADQSQCQEQKIVETINMEQAIRTLKEGEQQIINMKILGELTFKEIAGILNIPMGTVTWKYRSAIEQLRRWGYE